MNLLKRVVQFKKDSPTPKQKRLLRALRLGERKLALLKTRQQANLAIKAFGQVKIDAARQIIKGDNV